MRQGQAVEEWAELGDFSGFTLRGEGMANFVVAATHSTGLRVVWRFRKKKKTRVVSEVGDAYEARSFMSGVVESGLGRVFHRLPTVRHFSAADLALVAAHPPLSDYFPPTNAIQPTLALQMPDFTTFTLPPHLPKLQAPIITFEIKPKQAAKDPSLEEGSLCHNCLSQFGKWSEGRYRELYDFCPALLFSGKLPDMLTALGHLVDVPHNNLKISVNGELIHSDEFRLSREELESRLRVPLLDILRFVARVLTGSTLDDFWERKSSILGRLRAIQAKDRLGVFGALAHFQALPEEVQSSLKSPYYLSRHPEPALSHLAAHAVSNTVQDCSVLLTLQAVRDEEEPVLEEGALPIRIAPMATAHGPLQYAYRVSVVDVDAKSARRIPKKGERLRELAALVRLHELRFGPLQRPCRRL